MNSRSLAYWFGLLAACLMQPVFSQSVIQAPRARSGAVLGCVVELGNASPVAGATVTAQNQETGFERTGITAADGTFFLSSLAPGLYTISTVCTGFNLNSISGYPVRLPNRADVESIQISLARTGSAQSLNSFSRIPPKPVPQADTGEAQSPLEVRVRWDTNADVPSTIVPALKQRAESFSLIGLRQIPGPLPRQRMPELSSDQILVVMMDKQGEQQGWTLLPDPRIVRAESPGPNGELAGKVLYRSQAEFHVFLYGDPLTAARLKFYQPRWTGKEFALDLLGELELH